MFKINNLVITQETNSLFLVRTRRGWDFLQTTLPLTWHGNRQEMLRDNIDNLAEVFYIESPCWAGVVDLQQSTSELYFGLIVNNERLSLTQTKAEEYFEVGLHSWNKLSLLNCAPPLLYLLKHYSEINQVMDTLKNSLLS